MNKKNVAKKISNILEGLYPDPPIPLNHKDHYTLLISVILSARCTDARVNLITPHLFARASSPEEMVKLTVEEIQAIIRPCGLSPSKASAIWNLSKELIEKYGGKVPDTFERLEAFPGVGHKTASVVMAQAFHHPAFPVDTHIFRCARRWGLSKGKTVERVEKDLKELFPKKLWIKLHLQIIYFAREYCPARNHETETCPICSWITS
jgi:endonuclease-3